MDKKKLLIIIIILIILIICVMTAIIMLQNGENYEEKKEMTDLIEGTVEIQVDNQLKEVEIRNNFYIVKNCINKFYSYKMETDNLEENDTKVLYDLLDVEYIKFKGITKDNISKLIPKIKNSVININNMYTSQQKQDLSIYIVKGTLREKVSGKNSEFTIMVKIDTSNRAFSIFLDDYLESNYTDIKVGNNILIDGLTNINKNENNSYDYETISDETYVTDLFNKYKEEILYNTELAYKHLNEDYRQNRFKTLNKFKEYAKDNIVSNVKANLNSYQKKVTDNYTQYICTDQNGKYYIFRETSVMNYSLILDTYTIELPEVVESYNELTSMEKAGYNVQICIEAINNKDYSYVYNKLYDEFKNNNCKTEDKFIQIIKNNLFNKNKVNNVSSSHEGNTYIYNLNIVNENNTAQNQNMTIIMQLKEGTDFVMSFSFDK